MIVLTIGAMKNIKKIKEYIDLEFQKITPKILIPTCTISKRGNISFLYYKINDDILAKNYNFFFSDAFKLYASSALANLILEITRFDIIRDILQNKFSKYSSSEHNKLVNTIREFFYSKINDNNKSYLNYSYRKEILDSLMDFFEESNEFLLEGFIQFRLKEYKKHLEEVVLYIVKEYETQKEYKEFINLLKYFVDEQEVKEEIIHIIGTKDGNFKIYNKDKKDITEKCKEEFIQDFNIKDINYDDLLVSTLITTTPKQIVIHNYNLIKNKALIETISNIFQDRVKLCSECEFCLYFNSIIDK
ncbi:putative sporulation protein YtxC [Defluviitalea phaphyphila]|uniref:putative sporulation protein YtxC n=1 Tax=Defluviitalea phaphyphila TaxID=1473580 RepID=UPI000731814B|nr:putative sporulation protein YtxC [Defluviitalea phaphyphila]